MNLADITQLPSRGQRPLPHGRSGFCGCCHLPRATWPRPHLPALSTDPGASFTPRLGSTPQPGTQTGMLPFARLWCCSEPAALLKVKFVAGQRKGSSKVHPISRAGSTHT